MENNKTISLNVEDLFTPKKQELNDLAQKFEGLRTQKIESKESYEIVHKAEQELVKTRTGISKVRLEYTKPLELAKKEAILKEKELIGIIVPVEEDLKEQKKLYNDEQEKIKQDKLDEQRKVLQDRVEKFASYEFVYGDLYELSQMEEKEFLELLNDKRELFEKIQEDKKAEERKRDIENIKIVIMNCSSIEVLNGLKQDKQFIELGEENFLENIKQKEELFEMKKEKAKLEKDKQDLEDEKKKIADQKQKDIDDEQKRIQDEKQKKIDDEKAKEDKERMEKEAKEKAEKDLKIENDRIAKEQEDLLKEAEEKRKAEQKKLEKKKKYKEFLKKNGVTQEQVESGEFTISKNEDLKTITIFKKIDIFNY